MKYVKRLNQKGDTIVEVLICLAIFGAMLASAFALTNRNQATSQTAQERSAAVKVADGQLERLRAYTDNNKLPPTPEFNYFCMKEDGTPFKLSNTNPVPECTTGMGGRYTYVILSPSKAVDVGGNGSTYAVLTHWEGALNKGNGDKNIEEVKIFYSIYDTSNPAYATNTQPIVVVPPPEPEPSTVIIAGSLSASAECYKSTDANAGCPVMRAVFTWSDGSTNTKEWLVTSKGGAFADYDYSFTKNLGLTLKTVKVNLKEDSYGGTPTTDRNLYVKSLTSGGALISSRTTYGYDRSTTTVCDAEVNYVAYPLSRTSRFLCGVDPTTFFLEDGATYKWTSLGYQYDKCVNDDRPILNDSYNGCFKLGNSMFMYRAATVTYKMTGVKSGPGGKLQIKYGQEKGIGPGLPAGYAGFNVTIRVGSGIAQSVTLPVGASPQNIDIDIPNDVNSDKLNISWTNNVGNDPNLRIDSLMMCRLTCDNPN